MKYGTILRIARVILVIAIVAMMIVPLVGSLASINAEKMTAGIESKYELDYVNNDETIGTNMIKVNLNQIDGVNEKTNFYISIDNGTPMLVSGPDNAAQYIFEKKSNGAKLATIYDSDNKICMQKSIQYHDGASTIVLAGMKLPDNILGMASFSISMEMIGTNGIEFKIPYGSSYVDNGYLIIKTEISDFLMILSNSILHNMAVKVNVTVMGVASFYVDINTLLAPSITHVTTDDQHVKFSNAAIGSYAAWVGDKVWYHYNLDDPSKIDLEVFKGTDSLSKSITRESDGRVKITFFKDPTLKNPQYVYIDADYYDDIVKILQKLEVKTDV